MAQPLATSSRGTIPPLKLHVVRDPSVRVRQAVRDNNVPLLARLQHKTDLRNTDHARLTSLSWAALEGSLEVFEWLLLDYGHDDQELSRDADNNTILHLLAAIPSLSVSPHTRLLLSSPQFPPRPSALPLATQSAISLRMTHLYHTLFPFLLDWSNSGGKTALHVAAQAGNHRFINLLCDLGADVDLTDLQGNTPLHYAAAWGHLETVRVLLERECQFAARNAEGFTASEFAYSDRVMGGLQTIAREVFESRRTRRREERDASTTRTVQGQGQQVLPGLAGSSAMTRTRSGSVSTSASMGSNAPPPPSLHQQYSAQNMNTYANANPTPAAAAMYGERTSSLQMSRRGSDSQTTHTSTTASTSASASNSNSNYSMPTLMSRPKHLQSTNSNSQMTSYTNVNGPGGGGGGGGGGGSMPPPLPPIQTQFSTPSQRYPSPIQSQPQPQPYRSPSMPNPTASLARFSPIIPQGQSQSQDVPPLPVPPEGALMGSHAPRKFGAG